MELGDQFAEGRQGSGQVYMSLGQAIASVGQCGGHAGGCYRGYRRLIVTELLW